MTEPADKPVEYDDACCTWRDHEIRLCNCPDPRHAGDPEHPFAGKDTA